MRVLVVDDDPDYRMMLRMQLEIQHRIEVVGEASDGSEALAFLAHTAPDAMILDLMMPGMDGYETIEHVARDHPELPVVAYSAVASTSAQAHCRSHGIHLVRKSGDTTALVDRLHEMVE